MAQTFLLIILTTWCGFCLDQPLLQRAELAWGPLSTQQLGAFLGQCERQGLPLYPLENKIREGLAKNQPPLKVMAALEKRKERLLRIAVDHPGGPGHYGPFLFAAEKADSAPAAVPLISEEKRKDGFGTERKDLNARSDLLKRGEQRNERMMEKEERIQKKMEAQEKALEHREKGKGKN